MNKPKKCPYCSNTEHIKTIMVDDTKKVHYWVCNSVECNGRVI